MLSCSKSEDTAPQTLSEKLTANQWVITYFRVVTKAGVLIPDLYPSLPDYQKDNYLQFNTDQTFVQHDNVKRTPGETDVRLDYGTWTLNEQIFTLYMTSKKSSANEYFPIKVSFKTNGNMIWETVDVDGDNYYVELTKQ
jgi:hypothetical protein